MFCGDIGGAIIVGVILGLPMSFLTGHIRPGEATLIEAIGMVLLCGGIALWFNVSYLLASHGHGDGRRKCRQTPWPPISGLSEALSGLSLSFFSSSRALPFIWSTSFSTVPIILVYIVLRVFGRLLGAKLGGRIGGSGVNMENWMGLALMPQAGVALGMALVASHSFQGLSSIVTVIVSATVVF